MGVRCTALEGPAAARLTKLLRQADEIKKWNLHESNVQPDPVHLLVQIILKEPYWEPLTHRG